MADHVWEGEPRDLDETQIGKAASFFLERPEGTETLFHVICSGWGDPETGTITSNMACVSMPGNAVLVVEGQEPSEIPSNCFTMLQLASCAIYNAGQIVGQEFALESAARMATQLQQGGTAPLGVRLSIGETPDTMGMMVRSLIARLGLLYIPLFILLARMLHQPFDAAVAANPFVDAVVSTWFLLMVGYCLIDAIHNLPSRIKKAKAAVINLLKRRRKKSSEEACSSAQEDSQETGTEEDGQETPDIRG